MAAAMAGCGQQRPLVTGRSLNIWACSLMQPPTPSQRGPDVRDRLFTPGAGAAAAGTVELEACANDMAGFLLVVDANTTTLRKLKVKINSATSAAAHAASAASPISWSICRAEAVYPARPPRWSVLLDEPRYRADQYCYDALIPVASDGSDQQLTVRPGQRAVYWIQADTAAMASGLYNARIDVSAQTPGNLLSSASSLDVKLNVLDIVLPRAGQLHITGGFDHRVLLAHCLDGYESIDARASALRNAADSRKQLTVIRQLMRLAHAHGLDLYDYALRPYMRRDRLGLLRIDWQDYDAIVRPYLDGSAFDDALGAVFWPVPLTADFPDPARYGGFDAEIYREALDRHIKDISSKYSILAAAGDAGNRSVANEHAGRPLPSAAYYMPVSPAGSPHMPSISPERFGQLAARIKSVDPDGIVVSPFAENSSTDIYTLAAEKLTAEMLAKLGEKSIWLSAGRPPFAPPLCAGSQMADLRAAAWVAARFGDAMIMPDVLGWSSASRENPPVSLFYPGSRWGAEGPVASLRLKALAYGLRDVRLAQLLRLRGRSWAADAITTAMTGGLSQHAPCADYDRQFRCGWIRDGLSWDNTRRLLTQEFLNAAASAALDGEGDFDLAYADRADSGQTDSPSNMSLRLTRSRFENQTRRLRVEKLFARGYVDPKLPDRLSVKLNCELANDRRHSATVVMDLPPAPPEFNLPTSRAFTEVAARGRASLGLGFDCPLATVSPTGHLKIPLKLRAAEKLSDIYQVSAAVVMSSPRSDAITIDADLSDWPSGMGNVAGDFLRVGSAVGSEAPAESETTVLVSHDSENIYIAVRCEIDSADSLSYYCDNQLRYERLWPVGEDMVELIFDPGMTAGDRSDIYRLCVKPCGVAVSLKGLPQGQLAGQPWLSNAKVAVKIDSDAWYAELSIARNAFGPAAIEKCWGLNIARMSVADNALSSWSGARGVLYDPQSLGCMILRGANSGSASGE